MTAESFYQQEITQLTEEVVANALDYFEDQASGLTKHPIKKADLASARKILLKKDMTEADREDVTNRIQKLLASRIDLETTWSKWCNSTYQASED